MPELLWKVTHIDPTVASARYRAGIPALHLESLGWRSSLASLRQSFLPDPPPQAVIFAKAFSSLDLAVAEEAFARNVPVILDLCDNIFVDGYSSFGAMPTGFRAMAQLSKAIVVTADALAEVVRREVGSAVPVFVIPDALETPSDTQKLAACFSEWRVQDGRRTVARHLQRFYSKGGAANAARLVVSSTRLALDWAELALISEPQSTSPGDGRSLYPLRALIGVAIKRLRQSAYRCVKRLRQSARRCVNRLRWLRQFTRLIGRNLRERGVPWVVKGAKRRAVWALKRVGRVIARNANRQEPGRTVPKFESLPRDGVREILWFGNHGAPYGRFGLDELASISEALSEVAKRHNIRLTVVSNAQKKFELLSVSWPFPTRYLNWAPGITEQCLRSTDVVVIPNSLDEFSKCKSANRALLALHHGAAVVATRTPALQPLSDCLFFGDWVNSIDRYLRDGALREEHVKRAAAVIQEVFSPTVVARRWSQVLAYCISGSGHSPGSLSGRSATVKSPFQLHPPSTSPS